jgi:hypothetical protein
MNVSRECVILTLDRVQGGSNLELWNEDIQLLVMTQHGDLVKYLSKSLDLAVEEALEWKREPPTTEAEKLFNISSLRTTARELPKIYALILGKISVTSLNTLKSSPGWSSINYDPYNLMDLINKTHRLVGNAAVSNAVFLHRTLSQLKQGSLSLEEYSVKFLGCAQELQKSLEANPELDKDWSISDKRLATEYFNRLTDPYLNMQAEILMQTGKLPETVMDAIEKAKGWSRVRVAGRRSDEVVVPKSILLTQLTAEKVKHCFHCEKTGGSKAKYSSHNADKCHALRKIIDSSSSKTSHVADSKSAHPSSYHKDTTKYSSSSHQPSRSDYSRKSANVIIELN